MRGGIPASEIVEVHELRPFRMGTASVDVAHSRDRGHLEGDEYGVVGTGPPSMSTASRKLGLDEAIVMREPAANVLPEKPPEGLDAYKEWQVRVSEEVSPFDDLWTFYDHWKAEPALAHAFGLSTDPKSENGRSSGMPPPSS